MDKLDELIKASKQDAQPNKDFVNQVMAQVDNGLPAKSGFWHRVWQHKAAAATSLVSLIVILTAVGLQVFGSPAKNNSSTANSGAGTKSVVAGTTAAQAAAIKQAADTTDLQPDLNSISTSLNQGGQNLNNANGAVNDQQNEISIPTN